MPSNTFTLTPTSGSSFTLTTPSGLTADQAARLATAVTAADLAEAIASISGGTTTYDGGTAGTVAPTTFDGGSA